MLINWEQEAMKRPTLFVMLKVPSAKTEFQLPTET